jgi:hypothetical protein
MNLTDNDGSDGGTLIADAERAVGELEGSVAFRAVSIVQLEDGVAGTHLIAGLGHQHDPDGMVDRVFDPIPARAEDHRGTADELGVQMGQISCGVRTHEMTLRRSRQPPIVVDNVGIPALHLDDPTEPLETLSGRDRASNEPLGRRTIVGNFSHHQHACGQLDGYVDQVW